MELTPLPGHTAEDGSTSLLQAGVRAANDELDTAEAAVEQALQERTPMRLLLAEGDGNAQHHPFTFFIKTNCLRYGIITHLAILAYLLVMGIKPEILTAAKRPLLPGLDLLVQQGCSWHVPGSRRRRHSRF